MNRILFLTGLLVWAQPALAAPQPDFYPNAHYKKAGPEKTRAAVQSCQADAQSHLAATAEKHGMLRDTTRGAARGAAKGALAGAIFDDKAGRGAGAGAALGGLSAAGKSVREEREGSPEYRKFMEACLEDKGYKVIGWK